MITEQLWQDYCRSELNAVRPMLTDLGIAIDEQQVHLLGERFLTGGQKLVLTGRAEGCDRRVIIKVSSHPAGIREIEHERAICTGLRSINFETNEFTLPEEILFLRQPPVTLVAYRYVEQRESLFALTNDRQLALMIRGFEQQERYHADDCLPIRDVIPRIDATEYLADLARFLNNVTSRREINESAAFALEQALSLLNERRSILDRHCGVLIQSDFVPHNFRIVAAGLCFLDLSSFRLGNKYEGWARFVNHMIITDRKLERSLCDYVADRRGSEDYLCLQLMRMYKAGFFIDLFTRALDVTKDSLRLLCAERVTLWTEVLEATAANRLTPENVVLSYLAKRDKLRTQSEVERRKILQ